MTETPEVNIADFIDLKISCTTKSRFFSGDVFGGTWREA
jgi:hypothetical protein